MFRETDAESIGDLPNRYNVTGRFADTVLRPSSAYLPARKLEMGWCMDCHLERGAADDCAACHY